MYYTDKCKFSYISLDGQIIQNNAIYNDNIAIVDSLLNISLTDLIKRDSPPTDVNVGDAFIVGDSPVGVFINQNHKIACYTSNGWSFFVIKDGMVVFAKNVSKLYCYYSGAFNEVGASSTQASQPKPYIGDYKYSAVSTDHGGFLLCNGRKLLQSTYKDLFAVIGVSFGITDTGYFLLPDLQSRVVGGIGKGSGLSSRTMGSYVGGENHVLTNQEMPSHKHGIVTGSYGNSTTTYGLAFGSGTSSTLRAVDVQSGIVAEGGGIAHNNMQPTAFAGSYFIYCGVV